MSYRRQILTRFSRRDYLSMLIIGVTVAFLTGCALLLVAATVQTQAIAAEFNTTGTATLYESPTEHRVGENTSFTLATIELDGSNATVLGIPPDASARLVEATPEQGLASATETRTRTVRLRGSNRDVPVTVSSRPDLPYLPPDWYLGTQEFTSQLQTDGTLVLEEGTEIENPSDKRGTSVPLRSAAQFFVTGSEQALTLFALVVVGAGILITVIVFSVTRMNIQDRYETVKIIRATGGTPKQVRLLFSLRAVLVTLIGVAIGYAGGLIATRTAVNLGVFFGMSVSLDVSLTATSITVLLPIYLGVLVLGLIAGYVAVRPVSRVPPTQIRDRVSGKQSAAGQRFDVLPEWLHLRIFRWESLIPTIATVTVFLVLLIVLVSILPVISPLVDPNTATVMEPGSAHPVSSDVSQSFARILQKQGINASPEIMLFSVIDGSPLLTRGVEYQSFAAVTNATIVAGRKPASPNEAVIGEAAAQSHDVQVGEYLPLGGSTESAVTRVRVVGRYEAPGLYDDHLLVSLPTARHLSALEAGSVHVVRADRLPDLASEAISVTEVDLPTTAVANSTVKAEITAVNVGTTNTTRAINATIAETSRKVRFTIPSNRQRSETVTLPTPKPGTWTVSVGSVNRTLTTIRPDAVTIEMPTTAPTGSTLRVRAQTAVGDPIGNASISLANQTAQSDANGVAMLQVPKKGEYTVTVKAHDQTVTRQLTVVESGASAQARQPLASLSIDPEQPSFQVRPKATLRLENPWSTNITVTTTITGPQRQDQQTVTLKPGEITTIATTLQRNPPGEYDIVATSSDGTVLDSVSLQVTGDERLLAALATHGERASTPFSQAVSLVFGNLKLLVGAISGLGALMTIGGLTATFARGVHSRRRTIGIHRATGARPRQIMTMVLRDAVILGVVATACGLILGYAIVTLLSSAGYLIVFGIQIEPVVTVQTVALAFSTVLALVVLGAGLATVSLLRVSPTTALNDDQARGDPR